MKGLAGRFSGWCRHVETRAVELLSASSCEFNGNVGRQVRTVVKGQMQSDVTNANSNRIHDSSRTG